MRRVDHADPPIEPAQRDFKRFVHRNRASSKSQDSNIAAQHATLPPCAHNLRNVPERVSEAFAAPSQSAMPEFIAISDRRPVHRRSFDVQVFSRDDGLYQVLAELSDTKSRDLKLVMGVRRAGDPVHEMGLELIVDTQLDVLAARSHTRWMPYPGSCDQHGDAYARLVGLNLMKGFRHGVKERLSGTRGCTHLTELCQVLPTAVIQAFAGLVLDTREGSASGAPPFQLDRCHALRSDGAVVQQHYPRWYRGGSEIPRPAVVPAPSL